MNQQLRVHELKMKPIQIIISNLLFFTSFTLRLLLQLMEKLENLLIPHSLTLLEKDDLICVADRERSRILCYSAGLTDSEPGRLIFNVAHPRLGPIYAIDHIGMFTEALIQELSSNK